MTAIAPSIQPASATGDEATVPGAPAGPGRRGLLGEGTWVVVARLMSIAISVAWFKALATVLPPDEFGRWSLFTGAVAFGSGILGGALNQAIGRFAHDAERANATRDLIGRAALLHALLCLASAIPVAVWLWTPSSDPGVDRSSTLIFVIAASLLGTWYMLASGLANTLRLRSGWAAATAAEGIGRLGFLGMAPFLFHARTFWLPAAATVAGSTLGLITALAALRRRTSIAGDEQASFVQWRAILTFARPLTVVMVGWWLVSSLNRYVLNGFVALETVAAYGIAYGLSVSLVGMAEGIMSATVIPILYSKLPGATDAQVRARGAGVAVVSTQAILLGTAGLPFLGALLIRTFASEQYAAHATLVGVLIVVEWLRSAAGQMNSSFYARLRTDLLMRPLGGAVLVQLAIGVPLIALGGLHGAVAGGLVIYSTLFVLTVRLVPEVWSVRAAWRGWTPRFVGLAVTGMLIGLAFGTMRPELRDVAAAGGLAVYGLAAGGMLLSMKSTWEGMLAHG